MTIEGPRIVPGDTATAAKDVAVGPPAAAPAPAAAAAVPTPWWKKLLWRVAVVGGVAAGLALCPLLPAPASQICTAVVTEVQHLVLMAPVPPPAPASPATDAGR